MALEKVVVNDKIEISENGVVHVRECTRILEDGKELSSSYHRSTIAPGEDYSTQDDRVKAVCAAVHTAETIADYQAALANSSPLLG
jgi:hypothetical protein